MSPENNVREDLSEFEALLPWYVAGTLDSKDMLRMDRELEKSPELQRLLDLTLEEQEQTVLLNEKLGVPSADALSRLMAQVEAEPRKQLLVSGAMSRVSGWFESLTASMSPAAMGASAAAAAVIICIQAALLAGLYFKQVPQGAIYETASHGKTEVKANGPRALIAFQPELKASDMETFLTAHDLQIIEGPRAGGFYQVKFSRQISVQEAEKQIGILLGKTEVIRFAALTQ